MNEVEEVREVEVCKMQCHIEQGTHTSIIRRCCDNPRLDPFELQYHRTFGLTMSQIKSPWTSDFILRCVVLQ